VVDKIDFKKGVLFLNHHKNVKDIWESFFCPKLRFERLGPKKANKENKLFGKSR